MGEVTFYIEHLQGAVGAEFKLGWLETGAGFGTILLVLPGKTFFPISTDVHL